MPVRKGRGHGGRQRPGRRVGAAVEQRPGLPERRERLHVRVGGGRERRIEPRSRRVEQLVCGEGLAEVDVPVRIQVAHGNSGAPRLGEEDVRQTRQREHLRVGGVAGRELRELRRSLLRGVTGLMHATEPEIHVRVGDLDAPRIHLDARRERLRVDPFVGQQAAVHDDAFGATRPVRVIAGVRDAEVPERAGPDRGQGRRVAQLTRLHDIGDGDVQRIVAARQCSEPNEREHDVGVPHGYAPRAQKDTLTRAKNCRTGGWVRKSA